MQCSRWLRLAALLLSVNHAKAQAITESGKKLAQALDKMDVEKLWLKGSYVRWETGEPLPTPVTDGKPHTHCSAFAAAAAKRLGIYLQRPKGKADPPGVTPHPGADLANSQFDWLQSDEASKLGWKAVADVKAAQRLANEGWFVVASYREADPKRAGHIAIVRPDDSRSKQELERDGPTIIQAGAKNSARTTLRDGFRNHPDAWAKEHGVRFFAHAVEQK